MQRIANLCPLQEENMPLNLLNHLSRPGISNLLVGMLIVLNGIYWKLLLTLSSCTWPNRLLHLELLILTVLFDPPKNAKRDKSQIVNQSARLCHFLLLKEGSVLDLQRMLSGSEPLVLPQTHMAAHSWL